MKRSLLLLGLLVTLAVAACAQNEGLRVNIPFEFTAGAKVLPAGTYEFIVDDAHSTVTVRNVRTHRSVVLPVITLLAAERGLEQKVTFDKVGEKKVLEAIYPMYMGYRLNATKDRNRDETFKMAKKS